MRLSDDTARADQPAVVDQGNWSAIGQERTLSLVSERRVSEKLESVPLKGGSFVRRDHA
jgi:hypothetical protein